MKSYTFNITIYDAAFFGMLFVSITIILLLWCTGKKEHVANRWLAAILTVAALWIARLLATDLQLFNYMPRLSRLPLQFSLALGPLIYFYVLRVTQPDHVFRRKDALHFGPVLLEIGITTLPVLGYQQLNAALRLLAFLLVAIYLVQCHLLIESFYRRLKFNQGDRYRYELRWLHNLLSGLACLWLLWIPLTLANNLYCGDRLSIQAYYPLYLMLLFMLIWMAVRAFFKSVTGIQVAEITKVKPLLPVELRQKGSWLKRMVKESHYYQDPELSLSSLADKLGLHTHELSRIINQVLNKSFNDFINEYRVRAVIRKMQDPAYDHITLLGIAYESGFNSQSTFTRVFKQMTGKSALEYKSDLEKDCPSYKSGSRTPYTPVVLKHEIPLPWVHEKSTPDYMLRNYFKTAWRNVKKNKIYSILNVMGLAAGIVSAALIFLWVEDELTFNRNFAKRNYLYHVMQNEKNDAGINTNGSTPGPLAAALKAEVPGIVNSGRLSWDMDELAVLGEKSIKESGMYVDPSVLSMYALPFIYGNRATALNSFNDVVISETMSHVFFGNNDPVGKTIKMDIKGAYSVDGLYRITGVFKDLPANCEYHFQWLSPYTTWENANTWLKPWNNNLTVTIIELAPRASPVPINQQLKHYLSTKVDKSVNQLFLFSMNDWHLRSNFVNGVQEGGSIKYVRLFSIIALIILLIACINFMNLSTARSEQRAKEVGVLKVMGAGKTSLIGKFISESVLMSFMAILLAVILLYLLVPFYNELVQKQLSVDLFNPLHLGCLVGAGVIVGLMSGCYPAFYLSSFNPAKVLKGIKIKSSIGAAFIRKGLVVTQFSASVVLIIATMVVYKQVQHIRDRDLGYNKNNLIYMDLQGGMKNHFSELKNSLIATGCVENAALSLHDALHVYSFGDGFNWQGKNPNAKLPVHSNVVSAEYLKTMHMQLTSGRDFYPGIRDSTNIIINESMAKLMGKEGRVGAMVTSGRFKLTVVGIIKDFVYNDVYGSGAPLILFDGTYSATVMALRFKPEVNLPQALEKVGSVMKRENPGVPFQYRFADEDFNKLFASETLIGKLAALFALLAILISCLGLFGLAAYTAERRVKEIGIRKVLGASVTGITGLLAKEFMQLVTISCLIAFPVAWWFMHSWLQNYAYHTTIPYWVFLLAGFTALLIALMTVSLQAIKAAMANPVKSLRSE